VATNALLSGETLTGQPGSEPETGNSPGICDVMTSTPFVAAVLPWHPMKSLN
jgi:hypothetical protein